LNNLKQEDDEEPQEVEHKKQEDGIISQRLEVANQSGLMRFVGVDWIQIFVDQFAPELRFNGVQQANGA